MTATQREMILQFMKEEGSITTLDAFRELGCARLASRICELRKAGHAITGEYEHRCNRWGKPVKFMRYRFEQQA